MIAIVCALPEELAPIRKRLGERSGISFACTGDGRRNAARGIEALLARERPSALIGAGIAGALSAQLAEGDVVVGTEVRDARAVAASGDRASHRPDAAWLSRAKQAGARPAALLTAERVVPTAEAKAALYRLLGSRGAAATDVESFEWAAGAARHGVPWLILRAVFDRAGDDLPEYLARSMDSDGHVSRASVAGYAALHPWVVPELLAMGRRVTRACEELAGVLEALLA